MDDPKAREAQKKKDEEKKALRVALFFLHYRIEARASLIPNAHEIIRETLSINPTDANYNTIKIVLQLQKEGKLQATVNKVDANHELSGITPDTIEAILAVAPTIPFNATAPFSIAPPEQRPPSGVSGQLGKFWILSPKTRENLKTAGMIAGLSIGPAIFLGTGIAGLVLSHTAIATTAAVLAYSATATVGFPPLCITLLAAAGATLLVGGIILTALAMSNKHSPPILNQTFTTSHSISH